MANKSGAGSDRLNTVGISSNAILSATSALMSGHRADETAPEKRLTKSQLKKRARDKARSRAMVDLPPALLEAYGELAERLGFTRSNLIAYILDQALDDPNLEVRLRRNAQPAQRTNWRFTMELPLKERRKRP